MTHFNTLNSLYKDFKVTRIVPLPELQCILRELLHLPTGAKVLHIENDDPENVFCLSFQTLPSKSNGVAHILEHIVLCGSKKFPIKDPFFAMNRRSLNTFMNALTGSDFTCYPAATQTPQDFYNLLEVYIDAVFHPILDEMSMKQEGHRIEFEVPDDPTTPLTYRGIVFNEMKGALNSGDARMQEALLKEMFTDLTYGINSGGDPKNIPELTYQELLDFHQTYYQPSRCLFFFYGNMPLEKHLDFIQEYALKDALPLEPLPLIPLQRRFLEPKRLSLPYPVSAAEPTKDKTIISFGWLTCHSLEQETCLALGILEVILLDTDASPLKKALLKSGLCKQVSSFIDSDISEIPLIIQLKGCNPDNADALEKIIRHTLQEVIDEGIPEQAIENAIHQYEFHRSEITGDYYPFGLTLFMRSGLLLQHGGKPEQGLIIHSLFDGIRKKSKENPTYFTGLLKKWIIDNSHFVRLSLLPDTELERHEQEEEKERLQKVKSTLNPEEIVALTKEAKALKAFQDDQETNDLDVLPKVSLNDIPKKARHIPLIEESHKHLNIYHHDCFTNDIDYADIFFELPHLTQKELMYARLLTVILTQVGANDRSYEETLDEIQANTGGVNSFLTLHIQASDHNQFSPSIALRGKALHRKTKHLFPLLYDFITSPNFSDRKRLKEIISKHYTALNSSLNQGALKYAINLSASGLTLPSYIANLWYGLDYYHFIRDLSENFASHLDLIEILEKLVKKLFNQGPPDLVMACNKKEFEQLKSHHFYDFVKLKTENKKPWGHDLHLPSIASQGRIISSPVAFIGKVFTTVSYAHPDAPALNLSSFLFDNLTLHRKIREEGGAYGGGAVSNVLSGNYYFYSYRDPNIASSLNAFEEAIDNVLDGQFNDQDLEEAKMEMIQDFDQPISPGNRADVAYNWKKEGRSELLRQRFRESLLSTTCDDVIHAVKKHIVPQFKSGATVVFAGRDLLQTENEKLEAEGKLPFILRPLEWNKD